MKEIKPIKRMRMVSLTLLISLLISVALFFACEKRKTETRPIEEQKTQDISNTFENLEQEYDPNGEPSLVRNFYFIFDGSGSMGEHLHGERKIVGAKQAVRRFIEQVPSDVHLGLFIFDRQGKREVVSLEANNQQSFLQAIDNIEVGGGTPLARAIEYATDRLKEQRAMQLGYGEYNLIVVTDGKADNIPEASEIAVQQGISIYAIGLGIGENHPLNNPDYVVSYTAAENFDQLTQALVEAVAESPVYDDTDFAY